MIRPPRPNSKIIKPHGVHFSVPAQGSAPTSAPDLTMRHLRVVAHNTLKSNLQTNCKQSPFYNTKHVNLQTEESETSPNGNNQSPTINILLNRCTQRSMHDIFPKVPNDSNKLIVPQSNTFKIRQLSGQSKRIKQNLHPNSNKSVEIKNHPKQEKSIIQFFADEEFAKNERYQTDVLMNNPLETQLSLIVNYTQIFSVCVRQNMGQACIVLTQSLFEESLTSETGLYKLKTICQQLNKKSSPLVILKADTNFNMKQTLSLISKHKIKLDYLIKTNQKYISNIHILNLSTLSIKHKASNFIILENVHTGSISMYTTLESNSKYAYYQINEEEELLKFIKSLNLSGIYQGIIKQSEENIKYTKSKHIKNNTNNLFNKQQIIQMVRMNEHRNSIAASIPNMKHKKIKSFDNLFQFKYETSSSNPEFEQQYKNKLVQLIKVLQSQSKNKDPISSMLDMQTYRNNNNMSHYIKIKQLQEITSLMDGYISANTAYQIAGELIKNNGFNSKQISEFRKKCQGLRL